MPKKYKSAKNKPVSANGKEGFLLFEASSGRPFFRQYDNTKNTWDTVFKDYYITHDDLFVRICDNSAIFKDGEIQCDIRSIKVTKQKPIKGLLLQMQQTDKIKIYKCPECSKMTDGHRKHGECMWVISRRGGWRKLGDYDG